jgi:transcriptional regulator with XRE-family HTH domain
MIANERQYRITKNTAERFREALSELAKQNGLSQIHPKLLKAQRDAIQSQLDDLLAEVNAYEQLKAGSLTSISIGSFEELADGLISARIASGLSQKALAERLGLKEQQIQRYEAEHYNSASYQRLQEIARAIGIKIRKEILLPSAATDLRGLLQKLRQAGIDQEFVFNNLLSSKESCQPLSTVAEGEPQLLPKLVERVSLIYGWPPEALFAAAPLAPPRFAGAEARFKMPARR